MSATGGKCNITEILKDKEEISADEDNVDTASYPSSDTKCASDNDFVHIETEPSSAGATNQYTEKNTDAEIDFEMKIKSEPLETIQEENCSHFNSEQDSAHSPNVDKVHIYRPVFATKQVINSEEITVEENDKCSQETGSMDLDILISKSMNSDCLQCEICYKQFLHKHHLREHLLVHKLNGLACPYCSFKTKYKQSLNRHIKTKHGDKSFTGNIFALQDTTGLLYRNDSKSTVSQTPEFKCYCGFGTSYKTSYDRHVKVRHNPLKDFDRSCKFCNRTFTRSDMLLKHELKCIALKYNVDLSTS